MSARKSRYLDAYQFTVRPLSNDEGGGYLVECPDIPGRMSDGETVEEGIANGREALRDCIEVFREPGPRLPKPSVEARSGASVAADALPEADEAGGERGRQHRWSRDGDHC
jgi:predicted RNase H-like HicB family nuclease